MKKVRKEILILDMMEDMTMVVVVDSLMMEEVKAFLMVVDSMMGEVLILVILVIENQTTQQRRIIKVFINSFCKLLCVISK